MMVSWDQSGIYGFLLGTQGTYCFKPRGSPGSSPLRSDGSRDDQAGEAGPVEHSSAGAKSLKLRATGLSGCHPSGQQPRQLDRGARGPNKELLSRQLTEGKQSLKQLGLEAMIVKKERHLLYAPIFKLQKGMVLGLMKSMMNENQSQSPVLQGGGSHTLPNHVTGNRQSTRHSRRVITLRPGALLEIYFLFIKSSTLNKIYTLFLWLGKTIHPGSIHGDTVS